MKEFLKLTVLTILALIIMVYAWIGSVLQESYKLCPVTEEEMWEVDYE